VQGHSRFSAVAAFSDALYGGRIDADLAVLIMTGENSANVAKLAYATAEFPPT